MAYLGFTGQAIEPPGLVKDRKNMHHSRIVRFAPSPLSSGAYPMTDDDIRRVAPSVFATEPHESRSTKFAYIPTFDVLAAMRREGFVPMSARQGRSRIEGKTDYTKHIIRFRREGDVGITGLGASFPEVVLLNSHDGTSSYQLMAGVFRLICLNGMVVSEQDHGAIKVPHRGDAVSKVIEGSYEVLEQSHLAIEAAKTWNTVVLSSDEQRIMAEAAHAARFADADGEIKTPIKPEQLLAPRRREDRTPQGERPSLWLTHNVLQENMIRGGQTAWGRDANNRPRRVSSRAVNNIDGDVKLNKILWRISEQMAALKGAA